MLENIVSCVRGIIKKREAALAILCITAVELYALSKGIDGLALTGSVGGIAAIGGYKHGKAVSVKRKR